MFRLLGFFGERRTEEVVFEVVDGLVDEVAVRGGVPTDPEAGVAVEAAAVEGGSGAFFGGGGGGSDGGMEDEVGKDLLVVRREGGGEGEDGGGEEAEG